MSQVNFRIILVQTQGHALYSGHPLQSSATNGGWVIESMHVTYGRSRSSYPHKHLQNRDLWLPFSNRHGMLSWRWCDGNACKAVWQIKVKLCRLWFAETFMFRQRDPKKSNSFAACLAHTLSMQQDSPDQNLLKLIK